MPPRVHRADFVPPPIGVAYANVDVQGRVVLPVDLRGAFGERTPLFGVVFTLAEAGYTTVQPADSWPPQSEREDVERTLGLLKRVDPADLSARDLKTIQDLVRIVACRYLDGPISGSWQITIPATVLAWLGLSPRREPRGKKGEGGSQKRPRGSPSPQCVILIGSVCAVEIWSEALLKHTLPQLLPDFTVLRTEAAEALRHAAQ